MSRSAWIELFMISTIIVNVVLIFVVQNIARRLSSLEAVVIEAAAAYKLTQRRENLS